MKAGWALLPGDYFPYSKPPLPPAGQKHLGQHGGGAMLLPREGPTSCSWRPKHVPNCWEIPEAGKGPGRTSLQVPEGARPCPRPEGGLPASRAVARGGQHSPWALVPMDSEGRGATSRFRGWTPWGRGVPSAGDPIINSES